MFPAVQSLSLRGRTGFPTVHSLSSRGSRMGYTGQVRTRCNQKNNSPITWNSRTSLSRYHMSPNSSLLYHETSLVPSPGPIFVWILSPLKCFFQITTFFQAKSYLGLAYNVYCCSFYCSYIVSANVSS